MVIGGIELDLIKMIRYVAIFAFLAAPINCLDGVRLIYHSTQDSGSVELQNIALAEDLFDSTRQLKIICHGLAASSSVDWYAPLIEAYLAKGHQVIAIDWGAYADDGYLDAISASSDVSNVISNYIIGVRDLGLNLDNVHIIGHSLGAHIAGYAGKAIYNTTGQKIGRITGIDPAGPIFSIVAASARLDSSDAKFVDVIHTNRGVLGIDKNIGTADFYPDGGHSQNGCGSLELGCSHNIAPVYMIESVTSDNFVARQCGSYIIYKLGICASKPSAIMGESCDHSASGVYYLTTNENAPYGKG